MYRAPSPIFDVPEFPSLRRVKPLPKRRRTSLDRNPDIDSYSSPSLPLPPPSNVNDSLHGPPSAIAEELFARANDSLSAHAALQSYYMSNVQGIFKSDLDNDSRSLPPPDYGLHSGYGGYRGGAGGVDDEGLDGGDYGDHMQQPGNTKKRKVPANLTGMPHGRENGSGSGDDEPTDRAIPTGRTDLEYDAMGAAQLSSGQPGSGGTGGVGGLGGQRRGKMSRATAAGLQHKEMLRSRKRQLAVVLGALSHGDSLALDQALSTTHPFAQTGFVPSGSHHPPAIDTPRIRFSRRHVPRLARAYKAYRHSLGLDENSLPSDFPTSDFLFSCPCPTADRLISMKEEVASLHNRFEAELARQAASAAEAARQAAAALNKPTKRAGRAKQSRSASGRTQSDSTANTTHDPSPLGTPARTGKKKKRSALANASNPHHLRNYVPSRLPNAQTNAVQVNNLQNLISPLPIRFLSADVPPRKSSKGSRGGTRMAPVSNLSNPVEEWICPHCEYDLFYGDDQSFQRAIRSRKKILRRRRRARERAAAAASGVALKNMAPAAEEDVHPGFESAHDEVLAATAARQQSRGHDGWDAGSRHG